MALNKPQNGKRPNITKDLKKLGGDGVLVVGGGGREHAIVRALKRSAAVGTVYGAPGNAGMDVTETGISATDIDGVVAFVAAHPISSLR